MKLYHGTNQIIQDIDLSLCMPNKDFGRGFYLTDIRKQAEYMAIRKVEQTGTGERVVIEYDFDEHLLRSKTLRIKHFEKPTKDWARFILANRFDPDFTHDYDIVTGPIANDRVAFQLRRYHQEMISLAQLVRELTYRKLNSQFFFGTEQAVKHLIKSNIYIF